jgi:DNA processing protein
LDLIIRKLALHRIDFLRPMERRRLDRALEEGLQFSRLGFSALELIAGRLLGARSWDPTLILEAAERDAEFLDRSGVRYITDTDAEYPPLLAEIHDPPCGLFVRGTPLANGEPAMAIVGTREATQVGLSTAVDFGRELAFLGIPVISGLARGIDGAAHRGALAGSRGKKANTLAVLPVGIDACYPPSNRGLAAAIVDSGGTLVSEYPPGTEARTWRFPERNRIIAGIARGTLVVEAPDGSGALITARFALEEGRDVFVAAALLGGSRNAGAERLATEGARIVDSAAGILAEWGRVMPIEGEVLAVDRSRDAEDLFLAAALRAELGLEAEPGADPLRGGSKSLATRDERND